MKYVLATVMSLVVSSLAQAASKDCSNIAKGAALKSYHASSGTIQGGAPESSAKKLRVVNGITDYKVEVEDSNEDGEAWVIGYLVRTQAVGQKCKVIFLKKIFEKDLGS